MSCLGESENLKKGFHCSVTKHVSGFSVCVTAICARNPSRANDKQSAFGELVEELLGKISGCDWVMCGVGHAQTLPCVLRLCNTKVAFFELFIFSASKLSNE